MIVDFSNADKTMVLIRIGDSGRAANQRSVNRVLDEVDTWYQVQFSPLVDLLIRQMEDKH